MNHMKTENIGEVDTLCAELDALCDTGYAFALHIRFTRPTTMIRTYSETWLAEYSEKGLMIQDPVVIWGMQNSGLVYWKDPPDPMGVISGAARHGIMNGLTCSVGPASSRSISGFSRSSGPFSAEEAAHLLALTEKMHAVTA